MIESAARRIEAPEPPKPPHAPIEGWRHAARMWNYELDTDLYPEARYGPHKHIPVPSPSISGDKVSLHKRETAEEGVDGSTWLLWTERGPISISHDHMFTLDDDHPNYASGDRWSLTPFRSLIIYHPDERVRAQSDEWIRSLVRGKGGRALHTSTRRELISVIRAALAADPL